jgi:ketosteroid isomerase-like protein
MMDPRLQPIVTLFENLRREDLPRLNRVYTPDARFKDPFNEVQGVPAIEQVFEHMFGALDEPRFKVHEVIVQGDQAFLTWDFLFRMKRFNRAPQTVRGSSHLQLAADGRIQVHRDYWDVAEELYEKLPLVGVLMRWLKNRARQN